jgi:hypothetical protein
MEEQRESGGTPRASSDPAGDTGPDGMSSGPPVAKKSLVRKSKRRTEVRTEASELRERERKFLAAAPMTKAERDAIAKRFEAVIPPEEKIRRYPRPNSKPGRERTAAERKLSLETRMCGVRNRRDGTPCKNTLRPGAVVCARHGGSTTNALAKERERAGTMLARARARRLLTKIADDPENVSDPMGALENIGGQMLTLMEMMRGEIDRMDAVRRESDQGLEQIRGEITIYLNAAQRAESIVEKILRLDLDERRVRLQAAQAALVFDAWERALNCRAAKLSDAQRKALWASLQKELAPSLPRPTRADAIVDAEVIAEVLGI